MSQEILEIDAYTSAKLGDGNMELFDPESGQGVIVESSDGGLVIRPNNTIIDEYLGDVNLTAAMLAVNGIDVDAEISAEQISISYSDETYGDFDVNFQPTGMYLIADDMDGSADNEGKRDVSVALNLGDVDISYKNGAFSTSYNTEDVAPEGLQIRSTFEYNAETGRVEVSNTSNDPFLNMLALNFMTVAQELDSYTDYSNLSFDVREEVYGYGFDAEGNFFITDDYYASTDAAEQVYEEAVKLAVASGLKVSDVDGDKKLTWVDIFNLSVDDVESAEAIYAAEEKAVAELEALKAAQDEIYEKETCIAGNADKFWGWRHVANKLDCG